MADQVKRQLRIVQTEPNHLPISGLRVAFASSDGVHVDQHFGVARGYLVYSVTYYDSSVLQLVEFQSTCEGASKGRLTSRLNWVADCDLLYCRELGSSGRKLLLSRGVQPIRIHACTRIDELIPELQRQLKERSSERLLRLLERKTPFWSGDSVRETCVRSGELG